MALVLGAFANYYNYFFHEFEDPLTKPYSLIRSPIPVFAIVAVYNYFVLSWGPKFMANRQPYNLARTMMIFNAFQVLANLYTTFGTLSAIMDPDFSLTCEPISYADTSLRRRVTWMVYVYLLIKISDLLDTVFFVLRKKSNQISFLHVYHHSFMVLGTYGYGKFLSGSHGVPLATLNSIIHVIMYSYYFITLFKPELKGSMWWKKHITQLQMIQFAILLIYFLIPLFMKDCSYPLGVLFIPITQNLFMFALFSDFYIKAYLKKRPKPKEA